MGHDEVWDMLKQCGVVKDDSASTPIPTTPPPADAVEAAYREGFIDGRDHQNLSYKYPAEDEAWSVSEAKQALSRLDQQGEGDRA